MYSATSPASKRSSRRTAEELDKKHDEAVRAAMTVDMLADNQQAICGRATPMR